MKSDEWYFGSCVSPVTASSSDVLRMLEGQLSIGYADVAVTEFTCHRDPIGSTHVAVSLMFSGRRR